MTGALLKIDLGDQDLALSQLGDIISRTDDPTPMFESIGLYLVSSTQHRFDAGAGPDGTPWPPSLRVIAHGGKTLMLSTRLYRSFSFTASRTGLDFGTNVVYAAIHQFGGDITQPARSQELHFRTNKRTGARRFSKRSKATSSQTVSIGARTIHMPARPFIGLDDADDAAILTIGENWLDCQSGESLQ
jgi:phage gpG-like protein